VLRRNWDRLLSLPGDWNSSNPIPRLGSDFLGQVLRDCMVEVPDVGGLSQNQA